MVNKTMKRQRIVISSKEDMMKNAKPAYCCCIFKCHMKGDMANQLQTLVEVKSDIKMERCLENYHQPIKIEGEFVIDCEGNMQIHHQREVDSIIKALKKACDNANLQFEEEWVSIHWYERYAIVQNEDGIIVAKTSW